MRNRRAATLGVVGLVVSVGLAGCGAPSDSVEGGGDPRSGGLTSGFPGTWELESIQLKDASGDPLPAREPPAFGSAGAVGQMIADAEGFVGLTIMQLDRPKGENITPDEALTDLGGYTALFGTYTVTDPSSLVTIQIQGSRDPRLTGTVQTSIMTLMGDTLIMELPLSASGVQPTLRWQRLPAFTDPSPTRRRVVGFWRHVPNEGDALDAPVLRPGFIIYSAAGRMMVHLMDERRETYEGPAATATEAKATVSSYTSYFGPFTVEEEGGYFIHHRIGHTLDLTDRPKAERRTGLDTDAQRFYEFVENRMVLRYLSTSGVQPVPAEGAADFGGMITWERLSGEGDR